MPPSFNTNAGQDLAQAGSDFGTLIQGIGTAVAQTQLELTQTSVNSTSALASTLVDVIAVQETLYDDNGNITGAQSFKQRLPLIDFIDPVFYQWNVVRIQGRFHVDELSTAANATTATSSTEDHTSQHGLLVIFGGGSTGVSGNFTNTQSSSSFDRANAVGVMRMNAQMNPRSDIGVPKPTQVVQGPSLNVVQGSVVEATAADGTFTRTMQLQLQLRKIDGTAIVGKAISVNSQGVPWSFVDPAKTVTDAAGNVTIQLIRTVPPAPAGAPPADTSAKEVIVSARLGLVSNDTTVNV